MSHPRVRVNGVEIDPRSMNQSDSLSYLPRKLIEIASSFNNPNIITYLYDCQHIVEPTVAICFSSSRKTGIYQTNSIISEHFTKFSEVARNCVNPGNFESVLEYSELEISLDLELPIHVIYCLHGNETIAKYVLVVNTYSLFAQDLVTVTSENNQNFKLQVIAETSELLLENMHSRSRNELIDYTRLLFLGHPLEKNLNSSWHQLFGELLSKRIASFVPYDAFVENCFMKKMWYTWIEAILSWINTI